MTASAPHRIVVVGAGTGVGKTHVACALAAEFVRRGVALTARKPVESGFVDSGSDAEALGRAARHGTMRPRYAFAEPASPHLAARLEGVEVNLCELVAYCTTEVVTLVETAGGLLSPLSLSLTNLDLVSALAPAQIVLVAANRLGALHDVRACQLALAQHGLEPHVALSDPAMADGATRTNAEELVRLGWVRSAVVFPRVALEDARTKAAACVLASEVER